MEKGEMQSIKESGLKMSTFALFLIAISHVMTKEEKFSADFSLIPAWPSLSSCELSQEVTV